MILDDLKVFFLLCLFCVMLEFGSPVMNVGICVAGAGQDVGRSCILLQMGGKNIMLDCGMHMGYNDEVCFVTKSLYQFRQQFDFLMLQRRFPDFSYIAEGNLSEFLDCVIISHFHLDHCGALPFMTGTVR